MKVCRVIGILALSVVLCSCAGKQQTTETASKQQEYAGISRIEGASIETVQKETKVASGYESIVLNPIQMSPQLATDYPDMVRQFQASTLSYLKDKKTYRYVEGGDSNKYQHTGSTMIADLKIIDMRIVSEGARMWGGVMAGSSYIEVYLKLTDAVSRKVIHEKVIATNYNAFASTYASGSEKSLAVDMGKIIGEYLCVVAPGKGESGIGAGKIEDKKGKQNKKGARK
ncbi:MAG: hypothetical protein WC256_09410 [Desulfurivibrionaceae bacterium]|jgi:hypothetical protein